MEDIGNSDDAYQFGYPRACSKCGFTGGSEAGLQVAPYYREGSGPRIMLIGQDPTIRHEPERVKRVLMLDVPSSSLSRWLIGVLGRENAERATIYATNLVKCTLDKPPFTGRQNPVAVLKPHFANCRHYLIEEIASFRPSLVLALGEPAHQLLVSILEADTPIPGTMQEAFTGRMHRARLNGCEIDYSPCLHIQTFRVAETYGEPVVNFKAGLAAYFLRAQTSEQLLSE